MAASGVMVADSGRFRAGQTGLVVRVPEAEPVVGGWRERFDPSARAGVPAHVTVLFPFLDVSRIDAGVRSALAEVFGSRPAFDLRFGRCGRFPGVLYLAPEVDTSLRQLTETTAERWPEAPPYGGQFTEIVPHLTVADGPSEAVLDEVEAALSDSFPITSRVTSIDLLVHDGAQWHEQASFALLE